MDYDVEPLVRFLNENGIETWQSCQGGNCHVYRMPTVLCVARDRLHALRVRRRLRDLLTSVGCDYSWVSEREEITSRNTFLRVVLEIPFGESLLQRLRS